MHILWSRCQALGGLEALARITTPITSSRAQALEALETQTPTQVGQFPSYFQDVWRPAHSADRRTLGIRTNPSLTRIFFSRHRLWFYQQSRFRKHEHEHKHWWWALWWWLYWRLWRFWRYVDNASLLWKPCRTTLRSAVALMATCQIRFGPSGYFTLHSPLFYKPPYHSDNESSYTPAQQALS